MSFLPKLICRFNAIANKIPGRLILIFVLFLDTEKLILKFIPGTDSESSPEKEE